MGSSLRVLMARMAQKPPMPTGTIAASLPPANIITASPILIARHASPIAWLAVAQAEQVAKFGPRRLLYIENRPLAMLLMSIGIMKGDNRLGPRSNSTFTWAVVVSSPPMPEPRMTPISSRFSLSSSAPLSFSACHPA